MYSKQFLNVVKNALKKTLSWIEILHQSIISILMKIVNFAKKVLEDDDESFFIQIKKVVDVTKKRFIVITLSLHEQNPYVDFPRVDRYLFPNDKLDTDFGPSMEMKGLCPEKISEAFVPCELK